MRWLLILLICWPSFADATERSLYLELMGGANGSSLVNVRQDSAAGYNRETVTSLAYGGRVGGYKGAIGAELEYLHVCPHLRQVSRTKWPTNDKLLTPGWKFCADAITPFILTRYEGQTFQPFLGVGSSLMFARSGFDNCQDLPGNCGNSWVTTGQPSKANSLGLAIKAGVRANLTERWYLSLTLEALKHTLQFEGTAAVSANPTTSGAGERFDSLITVATVGLGARF